MTAITVSSAMAPATPSARAAPADSGGDTAASAPPAAAADDAANRNGSSRRASCQTGTAVFAISAAVYVDSSGPVSAARSCAGTPARGPGTPSSCQPAATPAAGP